MISLFKAGRGERPIAKVVLFYCSWQIWFYFCQRRENSETWKVLSLHTVHKGIANFICKNKKIRSTTARANLLKRHQSVEPNLNLGLHSLRSGGASATAYSDINERCIMRHGKWKSDVRKDGCIADKFVRRDWQYLMALDYHFSKLSALSMYFVLKLSGKFGKYAYLFVSFFSE